MSTIAAPAASGMAGKTTFGIILAVAGCHFINDIMQSLLSAIYPMLKVDYGLDFVQIGLLTLTFQVTASLLQPLIGMLADRRPLPYSLSAGMASTLVGLIVLGFAHEYWVLLLGAALIGIGSAVFHPESSRVARLASGGRYGLAQSTFQVGGNLGSALGPLLAAFVVLRNGQQSVAWFGVLAAAGIFILWRVGDWYAAHQRANVGRPAVSKVLPFDRSTTIMALVVLAALTFTKNIYMASISSYYTFFVIDRFGVSVEQSQYLLFLFLGAAAVGTIAGGPIGDRFGAKFVIWFSIIGVLPFTLLLPYADFFWTPILTVFIGLIFASAFPAIVVFAQELVPGRIGLIAGIFFGFAFGSGGIAAAALGALADRSGIAYVFWICSLLPFLGLLTIFLPKLDTRHKKLAPAAVLDATVSGQRGNR